MVRALMVIAPKDFRDEELEQPREIFKDQGWQVDVASTQAGEATGMLGAKELVKLTLDQIQPEEYNVAVVVGGMGSIEYLWDNKPLHQILNTVHKRGGVVAAICLSGAVLAKAGLLRGKQATVWDAPEAIQALKDGGATYTGEPVTSDGPVVTAVGPEAAEAFGQAVVLNLQTLQASHV